LNEGNEIICLDNYFTGAKSNIELLDHRTFEMVRHDIRPFMQRWMKSTIYLSGFRYTISTIPLKRLKPNGAINVLGLAKRVNAKVLQASTSEVYGDPLVHPQPESYWGHVNPIGIRSCYDEGKRCAETFMDYHNKIMLQLKSFVYLTLMVQ
jgi:UDP-glucuronate decarboxylase